MNFLARPTRCGFAFDMNSESSKCHKLPRVDHIIWGKGFMTDNRPTGSAHIEPLALDYMGEIQDIIDAAQEANGYVPTSIRIMAQKPNILNAFTNLIDTVLRQKSELNQEMKWLTAYAVSMSAGCRYCQAHTAANGTKHGMLIQKTREILNYRQSTLFSEPERSVVEFALAAGEVPNAVERSHFDELRRHFNQGQIIEIVSVIALFGWLNRWNDTFASDLEATPLAFAEENLADLGWTVGKHTAN